MPATSSSNNGLDCRSFWKAGSYEVASTSSPALQGQLESSDFDRARVHPKFLHSNATSHKWAFGAIAELLDNAVDEICNGATFVMVDKINNPIDNGPMLLFQDDGGGMDPEGIRHCMSLGFSNKKSKTTIGQYGNGFKTSTMRLGADAIVFSRANRGSPETQSIGLLSYTYLRRTMKDDIIVPMIDFQILGGQAVPLTYNSQDDWDDSMNIILEWSPFSSKEQLLQQFEDLGSHGTKVLIYNLWMNDDCLLELDFDDDEEEAVNSSHHAIYSAMDACNLMDACSSTYVEKVDGQPPREEGHLNIFTFYLGRLTLHHTFSNDILLRDQANSSGFSRFHKEIVQTHISYTLRYSLRAYASILYLRKFSNFKIILRGKPIQQLKVADELKFTKTVTYKPQTGLGKEDVSVRTTIGFAKEAPVLGIFGVNVYHKNRLIMPFWKVFQEGSSRGRCVVGVLEANFIEPAHDKQDFERTPLFIKLEAKLRQIIVNYWTNHCHLIGYQPMKHSEKHNGQKGSDKHSAGLTSKTQPSQVAGQHVTGLSANMQPEVHIEETVNGFEHVVGLSAADDITILPPDQAHAQYSAMEPSELREDPEELDSVDIPDSTSIEKLSEENIQLFARREELQQKETELEQTIEELERELGEAKRKSGRLAVQLALRKKQRQTT